MPYRAGFHNPELIYHTDKGADAPRDQWTFVLCVIADRIDPRQVVAALNTAERRGSGVIVPPEVQAREQPARYGNAHAYERSADAYNGLDSALCVRCGRPLTDDAMHPKA